MSKTFGWDLPPGVTNKMIDDQCGGDDEPTEDMCRRVMNATEDFQGENLRELLADIILGSERDWQEVLAETRGEIEYREIREKRKCSTNAHVPSAENQR